MMCCYYPTTTVVIDDDTLMLKAITESMDIPDCTPSPSPTTAIKALLKKQSQPRLQRIISSDTTSSNPLMDNHTAIYNLRSLHDEIYCNDRFNDVSVLIVDYYMPDTNGVEVCKALANHPAKKILLTGGADMEHIAINAFNDGIIHRYINKHDENLASKLNQAVTILKKQYFKDLTLRLHPNITTMPKLIIQHPSYISMFREVQELTKAVEYYVVDTIGTTLMLNEDGIPSWLVIRHESDMREIEQVAVDMEAPNELIQAIINRKKMPFFFSDEDYQQSTSDWKQFSYPCHKLAGTQDYYYSIFEGFRNSHINKDNVVSYSSFKSMES